MTPEDLVEIEHIRQLKARYFQLMDQKRWDEWSMVFCEDVTIDTTQEGSPLIKGSQAFLDYLLPILEGVQTVHHGHMPEIEITGARSARGVWSMEDYLDFESDPPFTIHGRGHYREEYEKGDDGAWRIKSLKLTRLWVKHEGTPVQSVVESGGHGS